MRIFLDTSACYAILDRDDAHHEEAGKTWRRILDKEEVLITTNYVLVECFALLQNRFGLKAVRDFQENLLPLVRIHMVTVETHRAGVSALLAASRKYLSLVDCVSFEVMRTLGLRNVFAFDSHFKEQGFQTL
jgi:predicted nucleic acid-binding protein